MRSTHSTDCRSQIFHKMTSLFTKSIGILGLLGLLGYLPNYLMFSLLGLTNHHHSLHQHISEAQMGSLERLKTYAETENAAQIVGILHLLDFFTNALVPFLIIMVVYHQFRSFYYNKNTGRLMLVNFTFVLGLASFSILSVASILLAISSKIFVHMYLSSDDRESFFAVQMFHWVNEITIHGFIGIVHCILSGVFFVGVGYLLIQDFRRKLTLGVFSILLGSANALIALTTIYRSFVSWDNDESFLIVPSIGKGYLMPAWTAWCGYLLLVQRRGTLSCFQQANADLPPEQRNQPSITEYMRTKRSYE